MKIDISNYDIYIVAFSGGKDSTAAFLWLLEQGVDRSKIELHHHLVDGREGSTLMDWPVTEPYCTAFAMAFRVPIYYSWKKGGFEGEMLRQDQPTAPICWETPELQVTRVGGGGPANTRMKFPQIAVSLAQRWCSAYLKIDVMRRMIVNDPRFAGKRILIISGERAEESAARACYNAFEPDSTDNRDGKRNVRHIDRLRPIHKWDEKDVWSIIARHGVVAHPAYQMGWGRCSCRGCIFGNANQFASLQQVDPDGFDNLVQLEMKFGCTIKRWRSLPELIEDGRAYDSITPEMGERAMSNRPWRAPIKVNPLDWQMPSGAFGESEGPE